MNVSAKSQNIHNECISKVFNNKYNLFSYNNPSFNTTFALSNSQLKV